MQIDIIVDTVCPWCYVGKTRFERALAQRPVEGLLLGWRPFQLNPRMPAEGKERVAYISEKFGGPKRAERVYRSIREAGEQDGIEFRFDLIERTPNTVNSHRLIAHAGRHGLQTEMVDALFRAYFTYGRDIGSPDVLADIAAETGIDQAEARDYLASEIDRETVISEDEMARSLGVNGVPCYIVDRKYAVSGAQSPEVFLQVLDLARQDQSADIAAE